MEVITMFTEAELKKEIENLKNEERDLQVVIRNNRHDVQTMDARDRVNFIMMRLKFLYEKLKAIEVSRGFGRTF